jgi:hypothetical protein
VHFKGVCYLHRKDGQEQYLYLDESDVEIKKLPVPEYFWKIVHNPELNTAIVGTNNIFIDLPTAKDRAAKFCAVIACPKWITVDHNTANRGYVFCCQLDEAFIQKIGVRLM